MEYSLHNFLMLLGSLGIFLYGIKIMSTALQKVAGNKLRNILSTITSNKVNGILSGFLITGLLQSSSSTTVMVMSFVNAGLLKLAQAVPLIMGANIGTTITTWLISILGFKFHIGQLSIPLIGIGFPLIFAKNNNRKFWGEFIIGFALLFLGLEYLKNAVPNIQKHPEILEFLKAYTNAGFLSVLLFLVIGFVLTVIIQSSSGSMVLILVMCNNGWIPFSLSVAMVLGANIGTTITALIASFVANKPAKKAALSHLVFNVLGAIWVLSLFPIVISLIEKYMIFKQNLSPISSPRAIPVALSIFHSSFNIITALILFGFTDFIIKLTDKIIGKNNEDETFRLKYIETGILSTSELSILQAKKEILVYTKRISKMFLMVRQLSNETNEIAFYDNYSRIEKYENISDRMEVEIAEYLTKVSEGELSVIASKRIKAMLDILSFIENISDSFYTIARILYKKKDMKVWFPQELRNQINHIYGKVKEGFEIMTQNIEEGYVKIDYERAKQVAYDINDSYVELKNKHLNDIEKQKYSIKAGILYSDILSECRKTGDFLFQISEAIMEISSHAKKTET